MNPYLVTFSLTVKQDYPELWGALKRSPYWHCLGHTWIVRSDKTCQQLFGDLSQHVDGEDRLLVIRLNHEAQWTNNFPQECQDWLTKNF